MKEPLQAMTKNNVLLDALARADIDFIVSFPSSSLSATQEQANADDRFVTVTVSNESEGVAVAAGAWLGGRLPVLMIENSGFGQTAYAVLRTNAAFGIPSLMVVDYRGDIGDGNWWAVPFGWSTEPMLEALRMPYSIIESLDELDEKISGLAINAWHSKYPTAAILRYGVMEGLA